MSEDWLKDLLVSYDHFWKFCPNVFESFQAPKSTSWKDRKLKDPWYQWVLGVIEIVQETFVVLGERFVILCDNLLEDHSYISILVE